MSTRYILYRLVQSAVLLWLATVVVFLLLHLTPTDPAEIMLAGQGSRADVERLRASLGLDKPLYEQYLLYMQKLARGDLGTSIRQRQAVLTLILDRLPATLQLALVAFAIASIGGILLGVLSAIRHDSVLDVFVRVTALTAQSMPIYWLGIMLIVLFAVKLRLLPTSGRGGVRHMILPAVTLASYLIGIIIRLTRSGMLEVLQQDYVVTARSKGLTERRVIFRHALKNAMIPVATILALQLGALLGGAVITETVFAWPGIGSLAATALTQRDYPVVQGIVLLTATMFIFVNLLADILYRLLDPRIQSS